MNKEEQEHLRNIVHRLTVMEQCFYHCICQVVDEQLKRKPKDNDWKRDKALSLIFRMESKPNLHLLLWAPSNYIGVFERFEGQPCQLLCYHDECWRHSLHEFLGKRSSEMYTTGFWMGNPLKIITLSLAEQHELQRVIKTSQEITKNLRNYHF